MFGKLLSWVKPRFVYWRGLVKEARTTSKSIGEFAGTVFSIIKAIAPGAVAWVVGKCAHFQVTGSILFPAGVTAAWLLLLMLEAAYKKHKAQEEKAKAQEDEMAVKLEIDRITYQRDSLQNLNLCRVTIRNTSTSRTAENVHVRMYGEVPLNIFRDGYSPFNEPDLIPVSSKSINPNSEADWEFSKSFNQLVRHVTGGIDVVRTLYRTKQKERGQLFSLEASASSCAPKKEWFEVTRDERGKVVFHKRQSSQPNTKHDQK